MNFASDNCGPAHPKVLDAVIRANEGFEPSYGDDAFTAEATERLRDVFEAPEAQVYLVSTGTAANAILLSSLCKPWQTVMTSRTAHIHEDECGAVEFMSGGSKITLLPTADGRIGPEGLLETIRAHNGGGVHGVSPGAVSITNVTERGTVYTPGEIAALAGIAHEAGVPFHMDGARFANAVAALDCTPAELSWRAGVDALTLGATKNGCLAAEAIVVFDPALATEVERRRMRAGHLLSKHRFVAAQFIAWLEDDLWRDLAHRANGACARLAEGLRPMKTVSLAHSPDANSVFADMTCGLHKRLMDSGANYRIWSGSLEGTSDNAVLTGRLVCDWSKTDADIDAFLGLF